ncbi:MAG: exo-alpha-sialidase [Planctomycetes bacterium]|nr:exo-alpha-sialidase [Planctomycetota bacterium]
MHRAPDSLRGLRIAATAASLLFLLFPCSAAPAEPDSRGTPGMILSEFIFEEAPFRSCHASTLAETPSGLVAAWFGGSDEGNPDVGIWVSRSVDGKWSPPAQAADGVQYTRIDGTHHRHPCWNPVLFQPPGAPLLLFYKCGPSPSRWWGMLTSSADGGESWSPPRRLPEHIDGPVKNKPVLLAGGRLLCGSSTEHEGWRVHFEITEDLGRTWQRTGPVNDGKSIAAIQPSILIHPGGKLQAIGRSRQGRIWETWSEDGGLSWSAMRLTELPNPNAGTDAITLRDGRHLLVYNHTARGRSPLNVAVSEDGKLWSAAAVLEDQPGEYSYPAVIQASDGRVHITYTWKRQRIRHAVLDPARLSLREIRGGQWPR